MASNITVDTLTKGSTTLNTDEIVDTNSNQICKAWVNFNGTGTVAIRDSYNVSSITDNGNGDYTVNFTNAMANANYSTTHAGGQKTVTWGFYLGASAYGSTTLGHRFYNVTPADTAQDTSYASLVFFGD